MAGPIALGTIRTTGAFTLRLFFQAGHLLVVARLFGPVQFGLFAAVMALAVLLGTLYSPLTLFLPISVFFFLSGLDYYAYTFSTAGRFTNGSALLLITSVLVVLIGLVSEQITQLLYASRSDS